MISPKVANLNIKLGKSLVDFTTSGIGAIENILRGPVLRVDGTTDGKITGADFTFKLEFDIACVIPLLDECVQFSGATQQLD